MKAREPLKTETLLSCSKRAERPKDQNQHLIIAHLLYFDISEIYRLDGWMDGWTEGPTDGQTDRLGI